MSATFSRALRHMAWANQRVYASLGTLPDEALESFIVNPEWSAKRIIQHIVSGADWYVYCLTGGMWSEVPTPSVVADVPALAKMLAMPNPGCALPNKGTAGDGAAAVPSGAAISAAKEACSCCSCCCSGSGCCEDRVAAAASDKGGGAAPPPAGDAAGAGASRVLWPSGPAKKKAPGTGGAAGRVGAGGTARRRVRGLTHREARGA